MKFRMQGKESLQFFKKKEEHMPIRTNQEIEKDLNETVHLLDRLAMEIAPLCARYFLNNDKSVEATLKNKVDAFRKAEARKQVLENELKQAKDR